jgi:hypothetical protein
MPFSRMGIVIAIAIEIYNEREERALRLCERGTKKLFLYKTL